MSEWAAEGARERIGGYAVMKVYGPQYAHDMHRDLTAALARLADVEAALAQERAARAVVDAIAIRAMVYIFGGDWRTYQCVTREAAATCESDLCRLCHDAQAALATEATEAGGGGE